MPAPSPQLPFPSLPFYAPQGPSMVELLAPHAAVREWRARVRDACGPHWDEVHALLRTVRERLLRKRAKL